MIIHLAVVPSEFAAKRVAAGTDWRIDEEYQAAREYG
jgi:hypothetical protein